MTQELINLLKTLSTTTGVSGYEYAVRELVRERYAPYVDEFEEDKMGSLLMIKRATDSAKSPTRKIMLAAHADEVGAMVTDVNRGFLRFTHVGGLDPRYLMGQEVLVFGRETYQGVITSRPPHFRDKDKGAFPKIADYQIDLGLAPDVVAKNVRIGDIIAFNKEPVELMGGRISGKALDNRASLISVYVCLKELAQIKHQWDVYAVASCQEEVGLVGATTSAYHLNPDVAIAIDVTFANVPGVADGNLTDLDKGPALCIGANLHPGVNKRLRDTATKLEMSLQTEPVPGSTGSDAWAIQTSQNGIPTALLSIPQQHMHSPVETVSMKDLIRTGRLMAHFIASLNEDFIDELIPKDGLED